MEVDLFSVYLRVLEIEDEAVMSRATEEVSKGYSKDGLVVANSLDFDRTELRRAHLFRYSTCISHMVLFAMTQYEEGKQLSELIQSMKEVRATTNIYNVTSLGGGPGSDIAGFLTFLNKSERTQTDCPPVRVTVVDAYPRWEGTFKNVMSHFAGPRLGGSSFLVQDLLEPLGEEVKEKLKNTHFLFMVKFLSAIGGNQPKADRLQREVFNLLPVGALVLILDNSGGYPFAFWEYGRGRFRTVFDPARHQLFQIDRELEPRLESKFGFQAQAHGYISFVITQKQSP